MSKIRRSYKPIETLAKKILTFACLSLIAGCLWSVGLSNAGLAREKHEKDVVQQDAVTQTTEKNQKNDDEAQGEAPVKWLPDMRVLSGAPTTAIDLENTLRHFCDEGYFGGQPGSVLPEDLELSLVPSTGDEKVANLEIEGKRLLLNWIPNATGKTKVIVKANVKNDPDRCAFVSFSAESWLPDYVKILMIVIGGGGLFLLGMKRMSDGLQAMAGSRLRRMVSFFTNNRFMAVGVGIVVTTLVQSSTATSVMALGFVNSGIMTLAQAIGVIIGSNVGTTTTGWLFTLNIGVLGLPILGVGALFYLFSRKEKIRNIALFTLGLGMIFFGLETLKNGLAPVSEIPEFAELLRSFRADTIGNALICVVVGCVTTFLAHSSAATLAITITLASLDALDLNSAAAIVIGSNIGTTFTALIAAIGSSTNTRRTAYFHVMFNVLGAAWIMVVFFPVLIPTINGVGNMCRLDICGKIALTHTLFNVANTIVFVPLIGPITKLLEKFIVDKGEKKAKGSVTGLSSFQDGSPNLNIPKSRGVVQSMFSDCQTMLNLLEQAQKDNYEKRETLDKIFETEVRLDSVQDETIDFISHLTPYIDNADTANSAREQIRLAEELETISDYITGVLKSNLKLKESDLNLPQTLVDHFAELLQYGRESLDLLSENFSMFQHNGLVEPMTKRRRRYISRIKEMRDQFLQKMFEEQFAPSVVHAVEYQLNAWRRVYEHLQNISEAMEVPGKITPEKTSTSKSKADGAKRNAASRASKK